MEETMGHREIEAELALESAAVCPHCRAPIDSVLVERLLRTKVNSVSSLPRRGQIMLWANCQVILTGSLGGLI